MSAVKPGLRRQAAIVQCSTAERSDWSTPAPLNGTDCALRLASPEADGCEHECAMALRTAELERTNRELDAFARELAHEIRTPISQVAAIAQMLMDRAEHAVPSDMRRWLELQLHATHRMIDVVQDMLDFARCSPAPTCSIDLSAMCELLRDEFSGGARRAPVQWHIQPQMQVSGNPAPVAMLMRNLLSNAVKYTRDAEHPVISVSLRPWGQGLCVSVEDNGVGFDQDDAQRLFEPFVRLHEQEQFPGTGLGLSLAKRVVDRHGGWIRAHGHKGQGARFEFVLGTPQPQAVWQDSRAMGANA